MKAISCIRKIQVGVHVTDVIYENIFYISELNVSLYKSVGNYTQPAYGVCLNPELLEEVKNHVENVKLSEHISSCEEVDLDISKVSVEAMILAKQHLEKAQEEFRNSISNIIKTYCK
jgi:hypothetical protein